MSRPEPSHIALLLFAGLLARPVEAQSGIRHVPRIERHELGLLAVTGDVVDGPRSSWITGLDQGPTGEPASLGLRGAMQLMDDSALSDVSGTLSTQRAGWDLLLGRHFEDGGVLAFGLETEASFYDFGGSGFGAGLSDPFNDVYESRLRGTVYRRLDSHTSFFAGGEIAFGSEDEAELASGVTAGASFGFGYRPSDALEVTFGIAGASRLEDDAYVLPFIGVDWCLTESTRLVAEGPEVRPEQDLGDTWELQVLADYDLRQFRLNDEGPTAGGAFRDEQIDLGAGLYWQPGDAVRFGLEGGMTVWRELTLLADGGASLGVTEVDPAPWIGISLSATF
ncbi:MAG: hypothetical protein ACYSWX_13030 [Planctomycetota bacterium]|jgi:hypothetical protein